MSTAAGTETAPAKPRGALGDPVAGPPARSPRRAGPSWRTARSRARTPPPRSRRRCRARGAGRAARSSRPAPARRPAFCRRAARAGSRWCAGQGTSRSSVRSSLGDRPVWSRPGRRAGLVRSIAFLSTLPRSFFGRSSTNTTQRGYLCLDSRAWTWALSSSASARAVAAARLRPQHDHGLGLDQAVVLARDHRGDRHRGVGEQAVLDLARRDEDPADLEQIVGAAGEPQVAALVDVEQVAGPAPVAVERLPALVAILEVAVRDASRP